MQEKTAGKLLLHPPRSLKKVLF